MSARRLLFVGGSREPGGLHVHTADVAQAAAELGCAVTVACVSLDFFSPILALDLMRVELVPALCIEERKVRPLRMFWPRRHAWVRLLDRHRGSDVVLVRGSFGETPANELMAVAGRANRLYTIEHSPGPPGVRSRLSRELQGAAMRRRVHRVVAVSQGIRDLAIESYGFPAERIALCLNWVDPSFRPPAPAERAAARASLGLGDRTMAFGFLGRLSLDKRGDFLLRAFAGLTGAAERDSVLVLAGDGWKAQEWRALAAELGIAGRVRFPGWQADPLRVLNALDAFVLPSLVEGFPLSLMEAMAAGLPCVAHPMDSTQALIREAETGFLQDMTDAAGLLARLRALLAMSAEQRRRLGIAGAARVAAAHSRGARLPSVLRALDIPLGEGPLPPPRARSLSFISLAGDRSPPPGQAAG
jgi:glycosyltransferase involved in cell wall biosynthesis